MSGQYQIKVHDAFGNLLLSPKDWVEVDYTRVENDIGHLVLTLPGYYDSNYFNWHHRITVERAAEGGLFQVDTDTVWLLQTWDRLIQGKRRTWTLQASCANQLLAYRYVDYNGGNSYSLKLAAADDMGKAIVSENMGAAATDTSRSLATYLSIAGNLTAAPVLKRAFENRRVLDILRELAAASLQNGTYLVFDITADAAPGGLTFRSFVGQRGKDRRLGTLQPAGIGPDFGNMTDVHIIRDYAGSWTRGIVAGGGLASITPKARGNLLTQQGLSPFGVVENYRSATNTQGDSTVLQSDADSLAKEGRGRTIVTGKLAETSNFKYGVHWGWGDYLPVQADGVTYDVHVERVRVNVKQDGGEQIDALLRSET